MTAVLLQIICREHRTVVKFHLSNTGIWKSGEKLYKLIRDVIRDYCPVIREFLSLYLLFRIPGHHRDLLIDNQPVWQFFGWVEIGRVMPENV